MSPGQMVFGGLECGITASTWRPSFGFDSIHGGNSASQQGYKLRHIDLDTRGTYTDRMVA